MEQVKGDIAETSNSCHNGQLRLRCQIGGEGHTLWVTFQYLPGKIDILDFPHFLKIQQNKSGEYPSAIEPNTSSVQQNLS